jgi:hypothetical protein
MHLRSMLNERREVVPPLRLTCGFGQDTNLLLQLKTLHLFGSVSSESTLGEADMSSITRINMICSARHRAFRKFRR